MKRKRPKRPLTEEEQLILGLLLVILLAGSLLYCLGFASLILRQTWEEAPFLQNETAPLEEDIGLPPTELPEPVETQPAPP